MNATEKLGYKNQLTIIGAGHCSLALAKLMRTMDFYILLYDDRQNLNTFNENNEVHCKKIIDNYSMLNNYVKETDSHFVVIMTFGYRTDAIAIKALANKNFAYLGVLGSQNKMKILLNEFEKEGVNKQWLSNIYTPIGLPIKSKTPEEIAISIAAQIIEIKNLDC